MDSLSGEGMHAACVCKIRNGLKIGIFCYGSEGESKEKVVFVLFLVKHAEVPESGSRVTVSYCDSTSVPKTPLTFKCTACN